MNVSSTFLATDGDGYELNMGRWSKLLAHPFLDFVGSAAHERVLDVGCGTGHLASAVMERADPLAVCGGWRGEVRWSAPPCGMRSYAALAWAVKGRKPS